MLSKVKLILVCLFALFAEVLFFNRGNVLTIVNGSEVSFDMPDALVPNPTFDGQGVEWLFDIGNETRVYNIVITTDTECEPAFFFTTKEGPIERINFVRIGNMCYGIKMNQLLSGALGISTYNGASVTNMTINKPILMFSWARVIAIVLIYVVGVFLFSLQKMPDYKIENNRD